MAVRGVTVKEIQKLDRIAIEEFCISSIVLMENAGRAVAEEVKKYLRRKKRPRVCIVCGLGNNAGDGLVAARHLASAGIPAETFLLGRADQLKHDAAVNYRILKRMKCLIKEVVSRHAWTLPEIARADCVSRHAWTLPEIARADCVVDAIFGVGLDREIEEPFRGVIETINRAAKYVIAVDIPSGLDGTTGAIYGVCVKADRTVTFSFPKKGFSKGHGPRQTGKIVVVDIGIPVWLKNKI